MKNSKKVALCGVLSALTLVVMLVAYIPVSTYLVPAVAGALMMVVFVEVSPSYALGSYVACSLLSLWLCEKEAAVLFALFFGFYPILKVYLEKITLKIISYILKFAAFNAAMIAAYSIIIFIFKIPMDESSFFGKYFPLALLAAGNVAFAVYDLAVTRIAMLYMLKFHKKVVHILK